MCLGLQGFDSELDHLRIISEMLPDRFYNERNENLVRKAICGLIIRFQILSVRLTEEVLFAKFIEAELLLATLFQLNDELLEHSLHLLLGALLLSDQRLLSDGSACLGGLLLIIVVAILLLFVIISLHFLFLYFFLSHTILYN